MNTNQTFTFRELEPNLMADIKADLTPMLIGEPGIGKSSILKSLANKMNTKVFVLSVNQLGTKEDLTGARTIKDPKKNTYRQVFFPHADVQDAIDYAETHKDENPILFLDEINRTTSDVTSASLALITERRLGTTSLPKNLRLVAAGNDQGNVISFDDASITRLSLYHVVPDVNTFLNAQPDLNKYVVSVLKSNPDLLKVKPNVDEAVDDGDDEDDDSMSNFQGMFEDNTFAQQTVPRTITYTSNYLNALGFNGSQDATEKKAFEDFVDIMAADDTNPDSLHKGLVAHAGDTDFTSALYDEIKKDLMNAFQKKTQQDDPIDMQQAPELQKPDDALIKDLNNAKTTDDVDARVQKLSSDEYQTLLIYLMTADGQKAVSTKIIDAIIRNLGADLDRYQASVEKEAEDQGDEDKKTDYLEQNGINGLDKTHKRDMISFLTRDQIARSEYTLKKIAEQGDDNENVRTILNLIDLFN